MSYENVAMSDRAFGWDDEIKNDGPDFVLLPEGDYLFTVTAFERARYEGGAKLPPCSMAKLTIRIHGGDKGETSVLICRMCCRICNFRPAILLYA